MKTPSKKSIRSILSGPLASQLKPLSLLPAAAALLALPFHQSARAATVTWNGASGADWNSAGNPPWSSGAVPAAADIAVFNSNIASVALALSGTITSVSFDTSAGATLAVGATNGGVLNLLNSGTVQILSTLAGTGNTIAVNAPILLTPASATTAGSYTFSNNSGDGTNTLNFGGAITSATTSNTETLTLSGSNTGNNTISGAISNGQAGTFALTKSGSGTWVLTGSNSYTGQTQVQGGTLVVGNGGYVSGSNGSTIVDVGVSNGNVATLTVKGTGKVSPSGGQIVVGDASGATGTLNVQDTAYVASKGYTILGNNSNAIGSLNLTSGTVSVSGVTVIANSGNGYANQTGGVISTGDALRLAYNGNATGMYTITGGTASFAYGLVQGNGSGATGAVSVSGSGGLSCGADFTLANAAGTYGLVDVSGGSFSMGSAYTNRVMGIGVSGTGVLNVRGGVATFNNPNYTTPGIQLGINAGASGQVNLLSGTLSVYSVTTGTGASVGTSLFNFNGGALQARSGTSSFMSGLTKATVYSGGAVIDTQGYNIAIAQPLLAASGTGLASIPVTASGSGYLAAPVVKITGGSGTGATAIATVNSGTISGITITNPGIGYNASDTLTFTLVGGNPTSAATLGTPTWAANLSGGLTKLGSGALALTASNTYAGTTTVTTGTVQVGLDSAGSVGAITSGPVGTGTLALNGGAISSNNTTPHTILNPVTFGGNAGLGDATNTGKLTFSANADLGAGIRTLTVASAAEFDGVLGNAGGLTKAGAGTLTLTGSNTYAGTTTVTAGALQVGVDSAGSVGSITSGPVGTGTLALNGGAISSNSATPHTLLNPVTFGGSVTLGDATNTGKLTFGANADLGTGTSTLTTLSDVAFLGSLTNTANLVKAGTGTMTLTGSSSYSGYTHVSAGKLVADSGGNIANTSYIYVGNNNGDNGTFTVKGTGKVTMNSSSGQIVVGNNNGSVGTLNVQDTASVTSLSHIQLGSNGGSVGILNLTSGTVAVTSGFFVGNSGNGYMNQSGGVMKTLGGYTWYVGNNANSFGSYVLTGGSANQNYGINVGNGGTGILSISGSGSFTSSLDIAAGVNAGSFGVADVSGGSLTETDGFRQMFIGKSGTGILNVRGGTVSVAYLSGSGVVIGNLAGSYGTVNILGGTLNAYGVVGGSGTSAINFNGGTLQARGANTAFLSGLTNAYVYSGGATIDTQGYSITVAQPLLTASGTGLATVPVSAGGSGYLSAPIVKITGGSGTGATAIATVNSGTISGITITNPGTGYSPSDTLTFTLIGGNPASAATLGTPTWAANTSGGLTKVGTGTLTLTGTNTYTGATTVNAGTLKEDFTGFGATPSNAISPASTLVLNGGTFSVLGASTSATTSQTFNGLNVNPGNSSIVVNANGGGGTVLNLGGITRNLGGTVDFTLPAGLQSGSNGVVTSSGAIGGWATVSGTDWAALSGGNIVAVSSAGGYINDTWASGSNTTVTASSTPASGSVTNSLRFAAAGANTVTLSGTNTLTSGGILVTGNVGNNPSSIAGGTLQGAVGQDLVVIQNNTSNGLTISSSIQDNGSATGLTKTGAGTLTLTGSNSYSGTTILVAGTLQVGSNSALGSGTVVLNAGTVSSDGTTARTLSNPVLFGADMPLGNATNNGALTFSGNVNLGGATRTLTVNSAVTLGGAVSNGGITKTGAGMLTLSGSNSYTGATTVSAGILAAASANSLPNYNVAGKLTVASSGTLALGYGGPNDWTSSQVDSLLAGAALASGAGLAFDTTNLSGTYGGNIANAVSLTKLGANTLTLAGSNSYTGATNINGGTLSLGSANALAAAGNIVFGGGTLQYSGANQTDYSGRFANSGGAISIDTNGQTVTFGSNIASSNTGGLSKMGSGLLILTGSSAYTGATTVNSGTLQVGNGTSGALSGASAVNVNGGGTLAVNLANSGTFANAISMSVYSNPVASVNVVGSGTNTLSGNIAGTIYSTFNQSGSGLTILTGYNTYSGPTNITNGALMLSQQYSALNSPVNVGVSNGLLFGSNTISIGGLGGGGNVALVNGTNAVALTISNSYFDTTYSGSLSGSNGSLTKAGAGTLTLTASSSYSGYTQVSAGKLVVDSGGNIAGTSYVYAGNNNGDNGALTVKGTGKVTTSNQIIVGNNNGAIGTLNVQDSAYVKGGSHIQLGANSGAVGTLNLTSGTMGVSNGFFVGNSGNGYVNQAGGVMTALGGYYWHFGNNPGSFGSYSISGGSATQNFDTQIGYQGSALLSVSGSGTFSVGGGIGVGSQANSLGVVDVSGGSFNVTWGSYQLTIGSSGTGVLNVRGGLVANTGGNASNTLVIGSQAGSAGTVNLISGTVSAMGVVGGSGASAFNFNGGMLQARGANTSFLSSLTNAYVYSGGAGIDTQGYSVTIPQPLLAASGTGVATIPVNSAGFGYLSAPVVQITGGSGTGATAVATMNSGTISGITITNPGTGYSPDDTLTFTLVGGNPASAATLGTPTWAANVSGGLTKLGAGTLTLTSANTYTGATSVNAGTLQLGDGTAGHDGSIASASLVNQGTLNFNLFGNQTYAGAISGSGALGKSGAGILTLTGSSSYGGTTAVHSGGLVVDSGGFITKTSLLDIGQNNGEVGTLTVQGAGQVTTGSNSQITIGDNNGAIGTLNVQDTARVTSKSHIFLGNSGGSVGVLNLTSGTVGVSAGFFVGNSGNGYVNQTGGVMTSLSGYYWHVGHNSGSFGSYSISGGAASQAFDAQIGYQGSALLSVSGSGSFSVGAGIGIGSQANSLGVVDVSGGSFNVTWGGNQLTIGSSGTGVLNVRGGLVANTGGNASNTLVIGSQAGSAGTVNLISGTVSAMGVVGGSGTSAFNFNGGTLQARGTNSAFMSGLSQATVYSGGAVIDSQGYNIAIAQPLLAASGTGLSAIAVSSEGVGYLSAPIVKITGGSGVGATAIANVSGGAITGFTITNPGTGYSATDTLTIGLIGGNPSTPATIGAPSWATNVSGGLTKLGTGTLTLSGSNSYSGGTTVSAGVLQLGNAGALGTGGLTVNAGTLDLHGYSVNVQSFSGAGGSVTNTVSGTSTLTTTVASGTSTYAGSTSNGTGAVVLTNSGAGTLMLSGSLTMAGLNANGGSVQIAQSGSIGAIGIGAVGKLELSANNVNSAKVIDTSSLTIATGGTLDLWDNALIVRDQTGGINQATNLSMVQGLVNTAFDNGAWDKPGITSSTVIADLSAYSVLTVMVYDNTVLGVDSFEGINGLQTANGGNQVMLKTTYLGDFDGNGIVNSADYGWLDFYYGYGLTVGDLNGDGQVNSADYNGIDYGYGYQAYGVLAGGGRAVPSASTAALTAAPASPEAVPEPGTLGMLLAGALGLLGLRRQRRND